MKILVASDAFKGSLSSAAFGTIAARALAVLDPRIAVTVCPMADGGEGTVDALVTAMHGRVCRYTVPGPLGTDVHAAVGYSADGKTAVVEMAAASGLPLLAATALDPLQASSYGTGQLVRHALDAGAEHIILGLGGTATNDAGAGLLQALGGRLLDHAGVLLAPGAANLASLARLDLAGLHPRLAATKITAASDVTNPLLGPHGATAVFGPQKGVTPALAPVLTAALARFADVTEAATGRQRRDCPGAGAAGGTGFALLSVLGADLVNGFDLIAERTGLTALLTGGAGRFAWLLTGEGRVDAQSRDGKFLSRLGRLAQRAQTPVIAFTGCIDGDSDQLALPGIDHIFPILQRPCSLADAMAGTEALLYATIHRVMRLALMSRHQEPQ